MSEFFNHSISGFQAMSLWEYAAVILSMAYLGLAMQQNRWCWPAAFISTLIYTLLFFNGALLMDSLLNVYYMGMAVYGWYCWQQPNNASHSGQLAVQSWAGAVHGKIIALTILLSLALGYIMDNYTHADFAYLDALTSCLSVLATYLVAKKVLENWLYWVVIDAVSIYLYIHKGFYPTTLLFGFYTLMSVWGYLQWRQSTSPTVLATNP